MSRGDLQEMEQSKTAVNANAAPADAMPKANASGVVAPGNTAQIEDLGGPTPQNYRPDDDSAKLKEPGATLKQVSDVITKNAAKADAMPSGNATPGTLSQGDEVEIEDSQEVVSEDQSEETSVDESINIEDDVNALLGGEELSEDFKEKAKTIFEAAVKAKISEEYDKLVEHFANELDKQVDAAKADLSEEVNGTVNYAIGTWMEQNQVAVDRGIRNEITEDFIAGLKGLLKSTISLSPTRKLTW